MEDQASEGSHASLTFDGTSVDTRTLADGSLPFSMIERIGCVLLVDDEPVMLMIMTKILEKLGLVRVHTAPDPLAALQKLRENRYGLILSDYHMEPLSGLDLLRGVKTTENIHTPFLLTTGTYDAKVALDAKAAGAQWFILKPFSIDQLRRKLREIIPA